MNFSILCNLESWRFGGIFFATTSIQAQTLYHRTDTIAITGDSVILQTEKVFENPDLESLINRIDKMHSFKLIHKENKSLLL